MPSIDLDEETFEKLGVLSRLMGEPVGSVVSRLLSRLENPDPPENLTRTQQHERLSSTNEEIAPMNKTDRESDGWVQIYKVYKGRRVEGVFDPSTHEVQLVSDPWAGKFFGSPTSAAVAVVEHYSGDVRATSNTNGRIFWKLTRGGGDDLRTLIGKR